MDSFGVVFILVVLIGSAIFAYSPTLQESFKKLDDWLNDLPKYMLKNFVTKDSAKKILLLIYAIVVLYLCVFHVPWRSGTIEHPTAFFVGYGPIWEAPSPWDMSEITRIDFNALVMELFATTVVAGVLFYLFSSNKKP